MDAFVWSSFALDPRDPAHAHLRAADHDRAVTCSLLDEAYAEGRLDTVERAERVEVAQTARTLGDLASLLLDLVPDARAVPVPTLAPGTRSEIQAEAERAWRRQRSSALVGVLAPSLITWAIWGAVYLASDGHASFPWPLIVMAATLANLLRVLLTRDEIVASEREKLERRRAKELARSRTRAPSGEETLRAARDAAKRKAGEAARALEADVLRRVNERLDGRRQQGRGPDGRR
ncbi:DUF1707 SHOCT-like domain-containing protein [Nocardioides bruguierae]|uniref:DUF1707 domain-containing protein n=1 Tax=Nocardioides bruguierae TaxID=2945102 RepID=A0A9X2IE09_9ACTN|nr:DUF1707 domain-containing protein [Nocardioides bruguierae]MCL8024396.1 DUF1707 domain-containing protein [Nocardioides bruguierae]MCM0618864.1 DUF1707 domain-containing protein [Nocardioides bruguierae]